MAIRFASGFDGLQTADLTSGIFTQKNASVTVQSVVVGNGPRALECLNNSEAQLTNPSGAQASFVIGGRFRFEALNGCIIMAVGNSDLTASDANVHICLGLKNDGTLEVVRGRALSDSAGGTVLGTSTLVLSQNTWYYIEFKGTIDNTTGSFSVRVNNGTANLPSGTNVDTQNAMAANYSVFGISGAPTGGQSTFVDDLYFLDGDTSDSLNDATDFFGDVYIRTLHAVTGNGALADSTPNTGGVSRGEMVDETTQDGDTTYNSFTAAAQKDSYFHEALGVSGTVKGVIQRNLVRKSDAGTATVRNLIRIGTTNYFGATEFPGITYFYINTNRSDSPATSSPFTATEVDAAQIGIERVS